MASKVLFAALASFLIFQLPLPSLQADEIDATDAGRAAQPLQLDLPAAPLGQTLERFMALTNAIVVVDSALTAGRNSTAVKGNLPTSEALRRLLKGTGLTARAIGADAFTLMRSDEPASRPLPDFVDYAGVVQAAVVSALCQKTETQPTHYRVVMRLWFDPSGKVERTELANSTGDRALDMAVVNALRDIVIGAVPPPNMPQPMKLAILPRSANRSVCVANDSDRRTQTDSLR